MYLKSIEVNGFKSFANRLVFSFEHGFTGIVGPNGSGKSNVADAVRWVLGEQSAKQLRGSKMEDVIFAGTENRKPLGYAYVALTMDNSDHSLPVEYDEVIIARRVYRSGESEYLLNGNVCRLKDVTSMFFDTGVGKEGYSIIGQGQIDKILSGKPEERRELFDEAAGIVKYKKNKAQTEKSLEVERDNLSRVNDIIGELEGRVGPLKNQSDKAKEYLEHKDRLKKLDINVFLLQTEEIKAKLTELEEKIGIVTNDISENEVNLKKARETYDELEKKKDQYQHLLEDKKEKLGALELNIERANGEINVLKEQIKTANLEDEHIKERLTKIEESLIAKRNEKDSISEEKNALDEKIDAIYDEHADADEELYKVRDKIEELSSRVSTYQSDIVAFINESAELKEKVGRYDAMLEQANLRKVEISKRMLTYKSEEQQAKNTIDRCNQELEANQNEVKQINSDINKNEQILRELSEKNHINQNKKAQAEQEYHRSRSRLENLHNMAERYDGYGHSIKRVMEEKKDNSSIHGVVADIINVNKNYEVAIETALGGSIQNIVVDDSNTAKKLIEILKKEKAGRATFLPLNSINPRGDFKFKEALSDNGVIGLANTLVNTKSEYNRLMEYLLGKILVCDNIDSAIAVSKKYNQSIRIVTLEGELINPGGSMSGGAFKNSSNLLGRKREMEELEERVKSCKELMESTKKKEIELNELKKEHRDLSDSYNEKLNELKLSENTITINMEQAVNRLESLNRSMDNIKNETEEIENQIKEIEAKKQDLYAGSDSNEEEKQSREKAILDLENEIEKLKSKESEQAEYVQGFLMKAKELEQQGEFFRENLKRIKGEEDVLNAEKNELIEKTGMAYTEIENITHKIAEHNGQVEAFVKEKEELTADIEAISKEQKDIQVSHKDFFDEHQSLVKRQSELEKEQYRLETSKEKNETDLQELSDYMWQEYELTYYNAEEFRDEELDDLPKLKKESNQVKNKIKNLGDVNVNAIEEYKEVSERYEFLTNQRDDIVKSEESLLLLLEELDTKMRDQFNEKFVEIQDMFLKVFKEMFGGGKASLSINDDEDVLTAGIQINAQPPGKKLQNMMQLSGGEKALTAIALLFAIQNLKPSPFCLLDEIEAALDDANVDRFAKYIHKLTNHTQFIVITHRRGTMEAADVLYGITMQEKGVSTMVSVDLIDSQLDDDKKQ